MDSKIQKIKKMVEESNHVVVISGIGVELAMGLNGVRAEHVAYDTEMKYGYSNDEIISSMFLSKRVEMFYQYYKEVILNKELKPGAIQKQAAALEKAGKLDGIVKRSVYPLYQMAGCSEDKIIELHGSVEDNYCTRCGKVYGHKYILESKDIPVCEECNTPLRPGFVLLGEMVDNGKMSKACDLVEKADVLLIVGAAMKSPLCQHFTKYYKGDKMILINDKEVDGDHKANFCLYGDISELFQGVTDIEVQEAKEDEQD